MKRNTIEIRVWMQRQNFRQEDIRRDLGYRNPKPVWTTIEGQENIQFFELFQKVAK